MLGTQDISESIVDFNVPSYLIDHFYVTGGIAFILNILVVHLILNHSGKLDSYRFFLLALQISCILSDLHISIFSQPVTLVPVPGGYANGIGYRWFGIPSHILWVILTFLLSGQIEVLTICFLRKHKAIMNLRNNSESSNSLYLFIYLLCISYTCLISLALIFSAETKEEQIRVLEELYPLVAKKYQALPDFAFYVLNTCMIIYYTLIFIGTLKTAIIVTILLSRMLKVLKQVQNQMSRNTISRHKTALRCLIMQFMTTPIAFVPACGLAITVTYPNEYSQKASWIAIMCMTTHSTLNSFVVILTYPEFRKTIFFCKLNRNTRMIKALKRAANIQLLVKSGY